MKRMQLDGMSRDYIMSFFTQPGRVISPAAISEVGKKRPEIPAATTEEVEAFVSRRINEANEGRPYQGFSPTSSIRVRDILQTTQDGRSAMPGFESHIGEFKSAQNLSRNLRARIAKTLAAFSNHEGGYVFIGVEDDGTISGLPDNFDVESFWDNVGDIITRNFTPFLRWDRSVVAIEERRIAVAYAYRALDPPIVSSASYTPEIVQGRIYFRYNRSVEEIRPTDLMIMLRERDRRAVASAVQSAATPLMGASKSGQAA